MLEIQLSCAFLILLPAAYCWGGRADAQLSICGAQFICGAQRPEFARCWQTEQRCQSGGRRHDIKTSISKAELLKTLTEISGIRRLACEQRKVDCVEGPLMSRPRSRKVSGHLLWSMLGLWGSEDQSCMVIPAGQQGKQLHLGLLL